MKRSRSPTEDKPPAPKRNFALTQGATTFEIQTPQPGAEDEPCRTLKVEDALKYLDKVKQQFGQQPQIYNKFLEIMKNFKAQEIDTPGVIQAVSGLFRGHDSLILGFNTFLPPGYKITVISSGGIPNPAAAAHHPPPPTRTQPQPIAAVADHSTPAQQPREFDHAIDYVTQIKKRFSNEPDKYKSFLEILDTYQKQQRSIEEVLAQVSELFQDHADLLSSFTYFLPESVQELAKERLASAGARDRGRGPRRRDQLDRPDGKYAGVGMSAGKNGRVRNRARDRRADDSEAILDLPPSEQDYFERVKKACGTPSRWLDFLKCLDLYCLDVFSRGELLVSVEVILGATHSGLVTELHNLLYKRGAMEGASIADQWASMPTSEIDFSKCQSCTPSYRALPDKQPKLTCSERGRLEKATLNDVWVSVPTGSEDFSFKHMRKNAFEEALFVCEDERYEVDMVIDNNASTIRILEPLAEEIETLRKCTDFDWQFRLDRRSLGVLHLKAIARVYGEHANVMLELLRKNPAKAVPIILNRLKQKDSEWRRARHNHNPVWKEMQEKNYPKSLDHRSFYFKQSDKKALTTKSLMQELKAKQDEVEADIKKLTDEVEEKESAAAAAKAEVEQAAGSRSRGPGANKLAELLAAVEDAKQRLAKAKKVVPELSFQYIDTRVHADAAAVLAYAVERQNSQGLDRAAVSEFWTGFLYKFFGFQPKIEQTNRISGIEAPYLPSASCEGVMWVGETVTTPYGEGVVDTVRLNNHVLGEERDTSGDADATTAPQSTPVAKRKSNPTHSLEHVLYDVALPWGMATLQASVVRRVHPIEHGVEAAVRADVASMMNATAAGSGKVRPVTTVGMSGAEVASALQSPPVDIGVAPRHRVYLTSVGHAFFRIHQILMERLARARELCEAGTRRNQWAGHPLDQRKAPAASNGEAAVADGGVSATGEDMTENSSSATADEMMQVDDPDAGSRTTTGKAVSADRLYQHFLTALYGIIDGSLDNSKFEDECRLLMGTGSYLLFTMDKLVSSCVKQLVAAINDSTVMKARALYEYQIERLSALVASGAQGCTDALLDQSTVPRLAAEVVNTYRANCAMVFVNRGEECYCIDYSPTPKASPDAPEPHTATLHVRYIGQPEVEEQAHRASLAPPTTSDSVTVYTDRLVGQGRDGLEGDQGVLHEGTVAENLQQSADATLDTETARDTAKLPFLARNVHTTAAATEADVHMQNVTGEAYTTATGSGSGQPAIATPAGGGVVQLAAGSSADQSGPMSMGVGANTGRVIPTPGQGEVLRPGGPSLPGVTAPAVPVQSLAPQTGVVAADSGAGQNGSASTHVPVPTSNGHAVAMELDE